MANEIRVLIAATLRSFTDRVPEFTTEAASVQDALDALTSAFPDAAKIFFDEERNLRDFINIYVNDISIRSLKGLHTELRDRDTLLLIPSMAGGSGASEAAARPFVPAEQEAREALISKERMKAVSLDDKMIRRYNKHLQLREINVKGQKRIMAAKVLIAGVGSLGGIVAETLAAAGVGTLGLADFDEVALDNLQSQLIHSSRDVNRPKVASAKDRIKKLNPLVSTIVHQEKLDQSNIEEIISEYDIVVDATDNYVARYLISDACVLAKIPEVFGAMYQFEGVVSVLGLDDGPCYRCLHPTPPPAGLVPTCSESGVVSSLPGVIGSFMATEVIKLITGGGRPLVGKTLTFDIWNLYSHAVDTPKDPGCPICSRRPVITELAELDYEDFCGLKEDPDEEPIESIDAETLAVRISNEEPMNLIDVREPHERAILRFPGAVAIPIGQLARRQKELDPTIDTIFICREGKRSILAIRTLREAGFEGPLYNLKGGVEASADIIFPSEGAWL